MCERCGDDRCNDPDSKWCSDILLMRYRAECERLREDAERFNWFFGPDDKRPFMSVYEKGLRENWNPNQWRAAIDDAKERT